MGRVACDVFSREGARIVALDVVPDAGAATAEAVRAAGGDAAFYACDVSREASVRAAIRASIGRFVRIDVLYNNAGIMPADAHSVVDTTVSVCDSVMAVYM